MQLTVGKNFAYTNKQFIDTIDEEELSLIDYKMFCRRHSYVDRELCQQNYVDREPIVSTIDIIQHEAGNTSQHLQSVCQSFESNASSNLTVVPADKFNIDAISTFTPLHECRINAPLASSTIDRPQQLTVGKNFAYTNKQFIDTIDEEELSLIENADQRRCAIPKDGPISSNLN
ncbi:hypothetical protein GJ496_007224 [Pomphorhynchus laevis]|nr:hypothetical protein GJ496_007224 [Pomphorhynchus laevis]